MKQRWSNGDFTAGEHFATAVLNGAAVAQAKVYADLLALDQDQLIGELSDE